MKEWTIVISELEQRLDAARTARNTLEIDRRRLLLPSLDSKQGKEALALATWKLTEKQAEIDVLEEIIVEARAKLTEQRHRERDEAIAALVKMLGELDEAVKTLQARALATFANEDADQLVEAIRQLWGLSFELVTLTGNQSYRRESNIEQFGGDSLRLRGMLAVRNGRGQRRGPSTRPWEHLIRIAREAA